jgi:hypothetical protein
MGAQRAVWRLGHGGRRRPGPILLAHAGSVSKPMIGIARYRPIADMSTVCEASRMGHIVIRRTLAAIFVAVASTACATGAEMDPRAAREQQWFYRDVLGSGQAQPTAVFLSSDYSTVVFSVTCDNRLRELVLRSRLEVAPDASQLEPITISSSSSTVRLRTRVDKDYVEGRTPITKELSNLLRSTGDLEVLVPSEMGEPLYVGRAEPLRKLALTCRN